MGGDDTPRSRGRDFDSAVRGDRLAFSLVQWMYVSQVKLSPGGGRDSNSGGAGKNGYNDYLIEEEEGGNDHNVVLRCAEI
ncbi:hypothetical protein C1H46_004708 [Malus baccata]|uniref:Uncharacterized protein n=1 Tax=Malus baccata TaxID=106549 RepID=A0A540NFE9_MALBA|nr:hypothetical protein C1H46_004708 [Malus baccata]